MKNQRGFTLLELMVVVAMVAIVATISVPSWQNFVANRRTAGASRDVYNALQHARMLAVEEGRKITIEYVKTGTQFKSLRVGFDANGNTTIEPSELDMEVYLPKLVYGQTNRWTMAYTSRGFFDAAANGTVTLKNTLTDRAYTVTVNILGTLRV